MSKLSKVVSTVSGQEITDVELYNSVVKDANSNLDALDTISSEKQSFEPYGRSLRANPRLVSDYLNNIAVKYGMVFIKFAQGQNPLSEFKRGLIPLGGKVETVVFDTMKPDIFDPQVQINPFEINYGRVEGATYTENFDWNNTNTILDTVDTQRFNTLGQFHDFAYGKIMQLYNGFKAQEFNSTKMVLAKSLADGLITTDNYKTNDLSSFQQKLKETAKRFQYFSDSYNANGLNIATLVDDIYIIIPVSMSTKLDVNYFANTFNPEVGSTSTVFHTVEVDEIPDVWVYEQDHQVTQDDLTNGYLQAALDPTTGNAIVAGYKVGDTVKKGTFAKPEAPGAKQVLDGTKVGAIVLDRDALQLWDVLPLEITTQDNPRNRTVNIFGNQKTTAMFVQSLNSCALIEEGYKLPGSETTSTASSGVTHN